MSMTREEAFKKYEEWRNLGFGHSTMPPSEVLVMAMNSLRPITREQVEMVWRGKWIGTTDDDGCTWYECSRCEHDLDSLEDPNHFCPACGAPMTDKAVDMVMERLEALYEET